MECLKPVRFMRTRMTMILDQTRINEPLSLTLSPLLRRGAREWAARWTCFGPQANRRAGWPILPSVAADVSRRMSLAFAHPGGMPDRAESAADFRLPASRASGNARGHLPGLNHLASLRDAGDSSRTTTGGLRRLRPPATFWQPCRVAPRPNSRLVRQRTSRRRPERVRRLTSAATEGRIGRPPGFVAQVSKPAVSPTSKSAGAYQCPGASGLPSPCRFGNLRYGRFGNLRYGRFGNLRYDRGPLAQAQNRQPFMAGVL